MGGESMDNNVVIVAERENSSMASNWTEYLCLCNGKEQAFQLFTGMYEDLAVASDYYNEETCDYNLPEQINGKMVVKIDDDVVVGGELGFTEFEDMIEFNQLDDPQLVQWLTNSRWNNNEKIKKALHNAVNKLKR